MGGGESLDNAGNEAGAFWHRGDDDVFGVGVGSTANRSKAVECRDADCCGEVAVATATDGEAFDSRRDLLSDWEQGCRCRLRHRRATDESADFDGRSLHVRCKPRHGCFDPGLLISRLNTGVDLNEPVSRHHVVGAPDFGDRRRDGCTDARIADLVDGEHLVRGLDQRVDALFGFEASMARSPRDHDVKRAAALPAGLEAATTG